MAGTLTIRDEQMQAMAKATPVTALIKPCEGTTTWIEIRLVDDKGAPIPGERYKLQLPDASIIAGVLDRDGKARADGILAGTCKVSFPGFDAKEWRPV